MLGHAILAAFGWVAVGWLPGYLLLAALRPGAGTVRNAAFAPVVAIGLVVLIAEFFYVCGVRLSPWNVVAPALVLPAAVLILRRARPSDSSAIRTTRTDRWTLLGAGSLGVVIWTVGIAHFSAVLPNDDGAHHALFAARIARLGTLAPSKILSGDLPTGNPTSHYYPLALHVQAAMVARLTGADVNLTLTVGYVVASSVVLPLGVYVVMRRLFAAVPQAAAVAAALAVTFPFWPHAVPGWGGIPVIVAMSEVPGAVDAVWRRRYDGGAWANGVLLGIAAYGLFQEHNTELVAVGLFALILSVGYGLLGPQRRSEVLRSWAVGVVLLAVLVAPLLPALRKGAGEATNFLGAGAAASTTTTHPSVIAWFLIAGNPLVLALAVTGVVYAVRKRVALPWLWCGAAAAALWLLCLVRIPVLREATVPWYSNSIRMSYLFSYFECTYAGVGVVVFCRWAIPRVRARLDVRDVIARAVPAAAVALLAIPVVVFPAIGLTRYAYQKGSVDGPDQRAGFHWLADHIGPGDRVLNQSDDGSGWMETLDDVSPVFALKANVAPLDPQAYWGDRWYLLTHAASLATDSRAQAAVHQWRVTFVYVNTTIFPTQAARLNPQALAASPAYRQVWHRGTVTIFAVTL